MLGLRSVAASSPAVAQRLPNVLQALAAVRKSVGLDGPQQLFVDTAPPVDLRRMTAGAGETSTKAGVTPPAAPVVTAAARAPAPTATGNGLSPAEIEAELATVPEPQRPIAAMLPLADLPPEWTVGKSGERHLETFNADNLYEKIDGRAESFIQYSVKGMAYTFYHPAGDPSNELQLYVFEMADSLKALGKYGSEKPEEAKPVAIGNEGYTTAGSTLFYAGRYYVQIISTQDDAKFAAFALELAKRVAARQKAGGTLAATPSNFFEILPVQGRQGDPKYVAQDVFGYSFLSDVFMADYKDGEVTWQGFLRPYRNIQEAKAVMEKYIAGVKKDGALVKTLTAPGADEIVQSDNIGLVDVVFRKGNTLAGANGATSAPPAESFARALAQRLPATMPSLGGTN
jgi:hypothetical protein